MKLLTLGAGLLMTAVSATAAPSCRETAGPQRSESMVRECMKVSQATHPPCNSGNPCGMIADEIRHGCLELAEPGLRVRPPAFCSRYR